MHESRRSKLSIVGAGAVGSSAAYAALIRGSAHDIAIHDIDAPRARAEMLDLRHGTQFTDSSRMLDDVSLDGTAESDVVVITAGAKQKPGQSRMDLVATNARMMESMVPALVERSPDAVYVVVSNPCDVLATVAQQISALPAERVLASGTVLDTSRLRVLIAAEAGVAPSSVHATIAGEHGDSEVALWSSASIGSVPILDWSGVGSPFTLARLHELAESVRTAAYEVIQGKGATNYAIGLSVARIVEAILADQRVVLPVSRVQSGAYGVSGVAVSLPHLVGRSGATPVLGLPMSVDERTALSASAAAIAGALRSVGYQPS
ncbi:MAG TPA: L-lactate dehydrogenase [Microbacteriaceae bacterium]|nr:L-lactate dehydrogenase [Microbacteriaceae bacterium]